MAGHGTPSTPLAPAENGPRSIGIAAASWHAQIMDSLMDGARRAARDAGIDDIVEIRVPGSFEVPIAAQSLARATDVVVGLGVVIRGETPHFEHIASAATSGLAQVALEESTPVGNGVLTVNTQEQAIARAGGEGASEDAGYAAAEAAIRTYRAIAEVRGR
ncbi:6,7-dimethyl-8-ribityllumazine synthase [Helcobacillus massiliensis]|uniref:6,7-dimethyl-8-ribityllumazine synthase n=1 Tax=Helcobacillus massiliensis TaxID=521392 RepID=A0A839QP40_9MICO|nr:6,7-dimethyl-8-ribityllumazine synthase [Helcobacillus massiliensis]MBB3022074.1 6,7-dimethyl-8-ribityllumazine synthase [Helcobacillus massiliensis]